MRKIYFFLSFLFIITFCSVKLTFAQQNSARLVIISGGNVPFNFNSLTKYTAGVTYTNWTTLGITMTDNALDPAVLTSWDLDFWAMQATFVGSGGNTLPLTTLQLTASNALNCGAATFSPALSPMGPCGGGPPCALAQSLVTNGPIPADATTHQVFITYDCGNNPAGSLIDAAPDTYVVDIVFDLAPNF